MKPAPFHFVRPQGLQHALEALAADPGAKVLAGGQSLVPLLSMRLAAPSTLVDINGLPDLHHVRVDDSGVSVGALARHTDVLASLGVRRIILYVESDNRAAIATYTRLGFAHTSTHVQYARVEPSQIQR